MKKHILLSIVLGIAILLFSNSAKSQNFQIVASFGTAHSWGVPNAVLYEIDYYYPFHQIVHINRDRRGRNIFFNVLLERRGEFVELYFGRNAIILDINYFNRYPLAQHICSGHCGYHGNFYRSNRVACNHRGHGHGHHRHNYVAYRSNRNYNSYASKNGAANRDVYRGSNSNYKSHNRNSNSNRNYSSDKSSRARSANTRYSKDRNDVVAANSRSRNSSNRGSSNRSSDLRSSEKDVKTSSNSRGRGSYEGRSSSSSSSTSRGRN